MPRWFSLLLALVVVLPLAFPRLLTAGDKKKKPYSELPIIRSKDLQEDEVTQTPPPERQPPEAVAAATARLVFRTSPLQSKGLLTPQTREALKTLLRDNRGATIVALRAFVSGSGDMRRIQDLTGEIFEDKHQPMPAITVVQAGGLPVETAQVVIESIAEDKKTLNPNGLAFVSAQPAASLRESLDKLDGVLSRSGMRAGDVVRLTCFVSVLDGNANLSSRYSAAAVDLVQMQREPVLPQAACEAVARLHSAPGHSVEFMGPSPNQPEAVLVNTPKVVLSGLQLGFGVEPAAVRLSFDHLEKALAVLHADLKSVVFTHAYLGSSALAPKVRAIETERLHGPHAPASTYLPFQGLPSMDARFGIDLVAAPVQ